MAEGIERIYPESFPGTPESHVCQEMRGDENTLPLSANAKLEECILPKFSLKHYVKIQFVRLCNRTGIHNEGIPGIKILCQEDSD